MEESTASPGNEALSRRQVLAVTGGSLATALAGCSSPRRRLASAPIPASPEEYRYAMMGTAEAPLTITYFGSWKCPYCAKFSTGFLRQLLADYVAPEKIAIKYRNLTYLGGSAFLGPDAPAAARAGLAVWNTDPQSYWAYHEYVMRHQPPEDERWATAETLVSFARKAGVSDPGAIRRAITEQKYEEALRATTDAATAAGVSGTPTLVIDGTAIVPLGNRDRTRRLIENALE
ncbi:MAG: thioredoxin domain-containing protein [Halodesulfurarchaeum sp.]